MKTIQHILSRAGAFLWFATLFCAGTFSIACSDDGNETNGAYLYIEGNVYEFDFGSDGNVGKNADGKWNSLHEAFAVNGCSMRLSLFSNMGAWRIEPLYAEDLEWLDVWPSRGENEGRFWLTVDRNRTGYSRVSTLNIISHDRIVQTIQVTQKPGTPSIEIDMDGMTNFTIPTVGASRTIRISANAGWKPVAEDSAEEWITFANQTDTSVDILVAENPQDDTRKGTVSFVMTGSGNEGVSAQIEVSQKGQSANFNRATRKTIAEVLGELNTDGSVTGNVYVEASVVSDPLTLNFDPSLITWSNALKPSLNNRMMWVQDASGRGLLIEFLEAAYNTYRLNDKLALHLVDQKLIVDKNLGVTKISGFTSDEIPETSTGSSVEPKSLTDFSDIDRYENSLVRIDPVEFVIPMGTYVNANETTYSATTADGKIDGAAQYAQLLRDRKGNIVPLYTSASFTERFARCLPKGSGPLTAIVTKNVVGGVTQTILRLRNDADNGVSDDVATRMTRSVVEFGPWTSNGALSQVPATTGTGTLKTSVYANVVEKQTDAIYWGWTYARRAPATVGEDGIGNPALPEDLTAEWLYPCLNVYTWWEGNGTSIRDASGEAWIAIVSTEGVTGDLYLEFSTSSSASGPRDFQIEWAESEDAKLEEFQPIGTYTVGNWNANYQCKEMCFKLPDALKGKSSVVIRHRVTANSRANGKSGGIGASGTNRIGYWGICEKK